MKRLTRLAAGLSVALLVLIGTGCTHIHDLTAPNESYTAFSRAASECAAATSCGIRVLLSDGRKRAVRSVTVRNDSTTWRHSNSLSPVSVPTAEIAEIRFIRRDRGVAEGIGLGVLVGGATGAAFGLLSEPGFFDRGEQMLLGGGVIGAAGGVLGILVGLTQGSRHIYRFAPAEDHPKN